MQCIVCAVYSMCSVQCDVCSVQCDVCSVQCWPGLSPFGTKGLPRSSPASALEAISDIPGVAALTDLPAAHILKNTRNTEKTSREAEAGGRQAVIY